MKTLLRNSILLISLLFFYGSASVFAQKAKEEQLILSINKEKDPHKQFLRILHLGEFYMNEDLPKADSLRKVLLEKSRVFDDSLRYAALMFQTEMAEISGNQEFYFQSVLSCQPFLNLLASENVQFDIYKHLGNYHSQISEFETADFYLNYAVKLGKRMRKKDKTAEALSYLSLNFMHLNEKDSALQIVDQAIQYGRRSSDKSILSKCFNAQAQIYHYFDQVEISVAKNIIALQLATEVSDYIKISEYSRELGQSQREIMNLDDAEYYFNQSYDFANRIKDRRQMALALANLGTISFAHKDYDQAIKENEEAKQLLERINDQVGLGEVYNNLGTIYREQKEFGKAANNFNQALIYYESVSNKEKIAAVYHNVGTVFLAQKKYKNALNYLERSIEIREVYGSKNQIYHTYRVISDVYKDIGNDQKSLEYMTRYVNYIDSNTTLQAATKIAELSELYRAEQRDRLILSQADSIERQRQEKVLTSTKLENSQLRNNFQMYIIVAILLIITLAGIIIFYRWNQSKIMQQQKEAEMSQTLLRAQMNPHFVFNAMSVIQSYIYENDIENSSKFLVNFSRLMRLILENSPKEEIPIEVEEDILQKYLATQKLRFEERFEYFIDVEPGLYFDKAMIPPMITQPFIENSIEHGQLHTIEGGFIRVSFKKVGKMLEVCIEDNGIGRKGSQASNKSRAHKSMAMSITRERIQNLNKKYRTEGSLSVEDYNKDLETGTKVLISLPYRTENQSNIHP